MFSEVGYSECKRIKRGFCNLLDNRVLGLLAMEEGAFSLSLAGLRIVRMALSGHDPNLGVGRGDS